MENKEVTGRVIINRNICDNAPECSGIEVCPTGALYWDEENECIEYDETICVNCGACAEACPVEAILFGVDEDDYWKKKEIVDNDTRTLEELNVERFGATPMEPNAVLNVSDIESVVNSAASSIVLIELFNGDSIDCLLHSIRVEEIMSWFDKHPDYHKAEVQEDDNISRFEVEDLPAILVFRDTQYRGNVSGHYSDNGEDKSILRRKLLKLLE